MTRQRTHMALLAVFAAALLVVAAGCQPGGRTSIGTPNDLGILSHSPTQNSQNAYLDQSIEIVFDQGVDPLTVNHGTIKIVGPYGTVNGVFTVANEVVIFTPETNFATNTSYSVTIEPFSAAPFCVLSLEGDGLDSQYTINFMTGTQYTPDTDPPSVLNIWVSDGTSSLVSLPLTGSFVTMNISPATSVIVEFDEGMLQSSFDTTHFALIDQYTATSVPGNFRFFNKNSRVVFYPERTASDRFLDVGKNYTLLLDASLQDDSQNPGPNSLSPAPIQVAFRTRDPIDLDFAPGSLSGSFSPGETVTAVPSGATGVVKTATASSVIVDALQITGIFLAGDTVTGQSSAAVANNIVITRQPFNGWNKPSTSSPYAEMFSNQNMLDPNNTSAIWNTASAAQRLEGGYGAAALAGSGVDGPFAPTQSQTLSTSTRPFGYNFTSISIGAGVTITGAGTNPLILRSQGNVTIDGVIRADGSPGITTTIQYNRPGTPGGAGGPGGYSGGAGNPPPGVTPIRSAGGNGPSGGSGGIWSDQLWAQAANPWAAANIKDFPGSGGGAGNAGAGGAGTGSNIPTNDGVGGAANMAGDPSQAGYQLTDGGGSGGGGGGGDDDSNASLIGDGVIAFGPDEGGAGGGGGGGVVSISSAGDIVITGSLSARGGSGGNTPVSNWSPPFTGGGAVGGGGGAGGTIIVQGYTVNIASASIDVRGGAGGIGWYNGTPSQYNPTGGAGGDGWIRLESSSGTILGSGSANILPNTNPSYSTGTLNVNTTQGQSLFFDTGVEDPDYIDNDSNGFFLNLQLNSGTVQVFVQGAETDALGDPDPQTYWPNNGTNTNPTWEMVYDSTAVTPAPKYILGTTTGINAIDRYRFFRLRVLFGNLLNVFPPGPYVTDLTFPFRD